jgi:uracil phosphoribosyltransferase
MQTLVADHPLIAHKLTMLRDVSTETPVFRSLTDELVTLLAYEATRDIKVDRITVRTPVAEAEGFRLARPTPLVIPVLRAGIGMLDGMSRLLPKADVGFVGLARDEKTLVASTYATRLPADLTGRDTFVLDPMLATGGTLVVSGVEPPKRFEWTPLYFKELRVIGSNGFGVEEVGGVAKHAMEHYFDFIADGLDLTPVITHRFPLERWDEAVLALKDSRRTGAVKVLLEP